ncbi:DUF2268 domain-containing protein [Streptococcus oricebi]|uniref:Zn-dependent protease n=1 Tax=Streptococcus oricebi TaxID=1547447 RepID=A0ABS5B6U4_9STRE|nr:DUF2268 domain-containing protein [Streptococcus oricebi]MBP2623719.1 Zn-dependent protease [Streptococcus oricebi]
MKIEMIRSDKAYQDLLTLPLEERERVFREQVLQPFKQKFYLQKIPFEAKKPGGFDIMMLLSWMNRMPKDFTEADRAAIEAISSDKLWQESKATIERSFSLFEQAGIKLPVEEYMFTILLGNPASPMLQLNKGYSGDGGIPGYIMASLTPNDYTLPRLQAALAHECNHNVRFQFIKWGEDTNLADWLVSEGLAESFAAALFGQDLIGPWVSETSREDLEGFKSQISQHFSLTGMAKMSPYLYGDEIAQIQGQRPVGLPYAAGYAYGYHLVQAYLKNTGKTIVQATLTPTQEILQETEDFWK